MSFYDKVVGSQTVKTIYFSDIFYSVIYKFSNHILTCLTLVSQLTIRLIVRSEMPKTFFAN